MEDVANRHLMLGACPNRASSIVGAETWSPPGPVQSPVRLLPPDDSVRVEACSHKTITSMKERTTTGIAHCLPPLST